VVWRDVFVRRISAWVVKSPRTALPWRDETTVVSVPLETACACSGSLVVSSVLSQRVWPVVVWRKSPRTESPLDVVCDEDRLVVVASACSDLLAVVWGRVLVPEGVWVRLYSPVAEVPGAGAPPPPALAVWAGTVGAV